MSQLGRHMFFKPTYPGRARNKNCWKRMVNRYVRQQKEIILYYREATTGDDGTDAEDWIEKNKEVVEQQKSD